MKEAIPEIIDDLKWAHPPSGGLPLWMWMVIVLGAIAAGAAFYFWRKKAQDRTDTVVARPPHEVAMEALDRLKAKLTEENYLDFIFEVSRILRVYIQARFGLRAPHRSTEEFLMEASESQLLTADQQAVLSDFLRQCDLVKFARRSAALAQMEALFETTARFVSETTSHPEPEPAAK